MGWSFFKSTGEEKSDTIDLPNQTGLIVNYLDWLNTAGIPEGWLLCYGQAVSRTTYAELFKVISTTYGAGDNSTTFNVPDLRGATAMGHTAGAQDTGAGNGEISGGLAMTEQAIGAQGGASAVKLTAAETVTKAHQHFLNYEDGHNHTVIDNGHSGHAIAQTVRNCASTGNYQNTIYATGPPGSNQTTASGLNNVAITVTVAAAAPPGMELQSTSKNADYHHDNTQPYRALLFLIKT